MASIYHFTNSAAPIPALPTLQSGFSISAPPDSDIWAKPPDTIRFNAPVLHQEAPLSAFRRARVDVRAAWGVLYDQGGLIIAMHDRTGHRERKWVKTGIEFVNGRPHVSTVSKDHWADWSLLPMPTSAEGGSSSSSSAAAAGATIEMVREEDGSLWIYLVGEGDVKHPIREVTWAFEKEEDMDCWIGAYAARPDKDAAEELTVNFENLQIETTG